MNYNKIKKISDKEFIDLIKNSSSMSEVLFKLGYSVSGNSYGFTQIKNRMNDLKLSVYDFKAKSHLKQNHTKVKPENLFCENSKHSRKILRSYIIRNNVLPYKCAICGISTYNNKPLSLQLDHINGVNNDNRLENLRFLCPNCHSQTETYCTKNIKIRDKYSISDDLKEKICSEYKVLKSIKRVAAKLNVVQRIVNNCVTEAGIKKTNQMYVIQYDSNHNIVNRFGSLTECCEWLIENNFTKSKLLKTCKNRLKRNEGKCWNGFYFKMLNKC